MAVLGSMIPIDVRRNETLLHRFFSIIAECIEGKFGLTTLSDAWRAAQTSNVVADIVQGSPLLESWASLEWMNLADRMTEWEIDGRFTNQNLYRDAEAMLAVSAKDHGLEQQYNEHLQRSYVPETLFYLMTGRPDRIVLKDDFSLKSRQQRRRLDELGRVNDRA